MPNRKFTTARAAAFWLGLTLHLALGTALYYRVSNTNTARTGSAERTVHTTITAAKP